MSSLERYTGGGYEMSTHQHPTTPTEVVDPVCGMTIAPEHAVGHVEHKGQTYYFCSDQCLQRFRAHAG